MKLFHVLVCVAAAVASFGASACSSMPVRAKSITKLEARSLSADVITRRTLDQLTEVLQLTSGKSDFPPVNVLGFLPFELPARLADEPGLCRKDLFFVSFSHEKQSRVDSSTKVRANGVETQSRFALLSPSGDDEACRSLTGDKFFAADSEYDARRAVTLLTKFVEQIGSEHFDFPTTCPRDEIGCLNFLKGFGLEKVRSVRDCDQIGDPGECWSYAYSEGGSIEIKTKYDEGRNTITSVKAIEVFVSVHEKID